MEAFIRLAQVLRAIDRNPFDERRFGSVFGRDDDVLESRDGDLKEEEEKGRFIGRLEMFVELTKRMMTKSDMTLDDAMAHLGLTDDEKQIVRFCLEP